MKPLALAFALLSFLPMFSAQTPSAAPPPPPSPVVAAKPPLTESLVLDWKDLKSETRPNGERRAAFDNPTATLANFECHITTLNPGEVSGPAHTHDTPAKVEEAILLKEGTIEVQVNDTRKTVSAGGVIYFAPKDLGAVRNVGQTPAVYFVVSAQAAPAGPVAAK